MFADYDKRPTGVPHPPLPSDLLIRQATVADCDNIAMLVYERQGGEYTRHRKRIERELDERSDDNLLLVAQVGEHVVGFGRACHFLYPADAPDTIAPEGWYLLGVIIDPEYRRLGIASELTRRRLEWIARYSNEAFYFVNARNLASIDLHERFGFRELTCEFTFPGVEFQGGVGILFRVDLSTIAPMHNEGPE